MIIGTIIGIFVGLAIGVFRHFSLARLALITRATRPLRAYQ